MSSAPTLRASLVRFLIYGPGIVIAMVSLFYLYKYYHASTIVITESTAPDLTAKNLDAWRFDRDGQPQYRVISATAQHYNKDNRTDFTNITGYLFMVQEPPWIVEADTAVATDNYATVYLNGHVYIHQAGGTHNMAQTLRTDHLTVYPQKKTAQTDAHVTATRPGMVTTSEGAALDLNNNSVKLHQSFTIYMPNSTS